MEYCAVSGKSIFSCVSSVQCETYVVSTKSDRFVWLAHGLGEAQAVEVVCRAFRVRRFKLNYRIAFRVARVHQITQFNS
jgi:hypothetical protein